MKTTLFSTKWLIRLFKGASLATVAIAFQACYGAPRDFGMDQYIEGVVLSAEGQPVKDIYVTINNDTIQYTKSDEQGQFRFFVPRQEEYKITFADQQGNTMVERKDTTVEDRRRDIFITVTLDKE
ncbi:carboxypeptidase-like regulatory domain-containing protein [Prevotella sp. 10(H)]|uniref:carboxypeptidase-like regulatory domain-containing protein n=1 Tax=Prevotella sp. 10(H) TaxID=1158294 RepID=UPI0004A70BB2|nr:carboxypeptidase-like regulatory domain-containing protein [Prevotella sp. 10(H)]